MKRKKEARIPNVHPGEILSEEFLKPMGITQYKLAKGTSMPHSRVTRIIKGEQGVTADTALRLAKFFGTTPEYWLNIQMKFDLEEKKDEMRDLIEKEVEVWKKAA